MKSRLLLPVLLCIGLLLSSCGTASTTSTDSSTVPSSAVASEPEKPSSTPDEITPVVSITGDSLALGNFKFTIPSTFIVSKVNDNTVLLTSLDEDCSIGLFAVDISNLDEAKTQTYLPLQHNSFITSDHERIKEALLDALVGRFEIKINTYGEIRSDDSAVSCMNATFTDSWFAYTILLECDVESDKLESYINTFAEFIGYAKYAGENPRFDFIQ